MAPAPRMATCMAPPPLVSGWHLGSLGLRASTFAEGPGLSGPVLHPHCRSVLDSIVIVGAGPAGRGALEVLPDARVVTRPERTAWHAEPGRLWVEDAACVSGVGFSVLILCADEPLLLQAL